MYMKLTQTNITIMLMLLFETRTVKLFAARQGIFNVIITLTMYVNYIHMSIPYIFVLILRDIYV
jgi:hypothetical protein